MKRRLFNLAAAVSLALCLAMAAFWIRSYRHLDQIQHWSAATAQRQQTAYALASGSGMLINAWVHCTPSSMRGWRTKSDRNPGRTTILAGLGLGFFRCGFGWGHETWGYTGFVADQRWVLLPDWLVVLLLALAPARWLLLKRRQIRNRPRHLCNNCGYDLRATPDATGPLLPRCPECGVPASKEPPQTR